MMTGFFKSAPTFSFFLEKKRNIKVAEEYCWAMARAATDQFPVRWCMNLVYENGPLLHI
jgi:hypothetical protein